MKKAKYIYFQLLKKKEKNKIYFNGILFKFFMYFYFFSLIQFNNRIIFDNLFYVYYLINKNYFIIERV